MKKAGRGMKNQALAAIAMAVASLGVGAVPQTVPVNQNQAPSQSQKHNEGLDRQINIVRRGPVTPLNPAGIGDIYFGNQGRTPKEYGMWLQQTGRQKWTKAKRK